MKLPELDLGDDFWSFRTSELDLPSSFDGEKQVNSTLLNVMRIVIKALGVKDVVELVNGVPHDGHGPRCNVEVDCQQAPWHHVGTFRTETNSKEIVVLCDLGLVEKLCQQKKIKICLGRIELRRIEERYWR
jgi:hypothetical protein